MIDKRLKNSYNGLPLVSEGGRGALMKSVSQTPQIPGELNDEENLNESTPFRGSPDSP